MDPFQQWQQATFDSDASRETGAEENLAVDWEVSDYSPDNPWSDWSPLEDQAAD